jgi:NADH dehydrogenase
VLSPDAACFGRSNPLSAATETAEKVQSAAARSGNRRPQVVIVGGGFAGINAAKALEKANVDVTVIDRRNHHLFQPLLYQVATGTLPPGDISSPIRGMLHHQKNAKVMLAEVTSINAEGREVILADGSTVAYDYLVLAVGARHSYFGHDEWEQFAPGLKNLDDANALRSQIFTAFEKAEHATSDEERKKLLTFAIIGGGPTGVELAGAIAEIAHHTIAKDFKNYDPRNAKILLIEALPRIMPMFSENLSASTQKQLEEIGVTVRTNGMVTLIEEHKVHLGDDVIEADTIIWAAGVAAGPLAKTIGVPVDRAGRITIQPDLTIEGHPEIYVIGDVSALPSGPEGRPLPGIAPVAQQEGTHAGENIARAVNGEPLTEFTYKDPGSMAVIGRNRAIASIRGRELSGPAAWVLWEGAHVTKLHGFRNKLAVGWRWGTSYFTFNRDSRIIDESLDSSS